MLAGVQVVGGTPLSLPATARLVPGSQGRAEAPKLGLRTDPSMAHCSLWCWNPMLILCQPLGSGGYSLPKAKTSLTGEEVAYVRPPGLPAPSPQAFEKVKVSDSLRPHGL